MNSWQSKTYRESTGPYDQRYKISNTKSGRTALMPQSVAVRGVLKDMKLVFYCCQTDIDQLYCLWNRKRGRLSKHHRVICRSNQKRQNDSSARRIDGRFGKIRLCIPEVVFH